MRWCDSKCFKRDLPVKPKHGVQLFLYIKIAIDIKTISYNMGFLRRAADEILYSGQFARDNIIFIYPPRQAPLFWCRLKHALLMMFDIHNR